MGTPLMPKEYRQMVLVRRRAFVHAYLTNGGQALDALIQAGYPAENKQALSHRASSLFKNPVVQKMLRAQMVTRSGIEQDRIHEEIKLLVKEAKERFMQAKEAKLDALKASDALKWEEQANNRFRLLLQATQLMLESCTKTLDFRRKKGDESGEGKTLSLVQNVVIVDRKSEEARVAHEGAHDALDLSPSRIVNAG
jgi:hypothetical protein